MDRAAATDTEPRPRSAVSGDACSWHGWRFEKKQVIRLFHSLSALTALHQAAEVKSRICWKNMEGCVSVELNNAPAFRWPQWKDTPLWRRGYPDRCAHARPFRS